MLTITQGRASFKITGAGIDWRAMMKFSEENPTAIDHSMHDDPDGFKDLMRLQQVEEAIKKAEKFRKPTVRKGTREYPKFGAHLSTAEYVRDYFAMNKESGLTASGFMPLSKQVTPIKGEYSEEHES